MAPAGEKKLCFVLFLFFTLTLTLRAAEGSIEWISSINHENRNRAFKVHVPPGYNGKKALPLVIVLHGGGGRPSQAEKFTAFSTFADVENFIAAYPAGFYTQWNDGRKIPGSFVHRLKIDDTGFILKMIGVIESKYRIDPGRVYAAGISNGGFMAIRLACELSEKIAAVAAVAAGMSPYLASECRPKEPVSILLINGEDDPLVPYKGGIISVGGKKRGSVLSAGKIIKLWRTYDKCGKNVVKAGIIDNVEEDGTSVQFLKYRGKGCGVWLYSIAGGGHTWPGGPQYLPEKFIGKVSREFGATELIWEFFKKYPKDK